MIKAIIIENEQKNVDELSRILSHDYPEIKIVDVSEGTEEGIEAIKKNDPDLVFLDIELDEVRGGFRILKETQSYHYEVIFTTSYDKHAKEAFKFSAIHFLDKPIDSKELAIAIERFRKRAAPDSQKSKATLVHNNNEQDFLKRILAIPVQGGYDFVQVSEIIMCQANDNYTEFFIKGKPQKLIVSKSLGMIAEELKDPNFHRVHRSYLINLNHIRNFRNDNAGGTIEMSDGHIAFISKSQKEEFLKKIKSK